ncbi:hypothetical protein E2C01_075602 [Portunus trituberculatus]|uniref:Uncharacterized protein n=1 Tax=Portunus trituberculatus TaxID=210409 RepID=A0A5B7IFD5_PORTR|nr:hypothetical protein [Portunus trituberculatus]
MLTAWRSGERRKPGGNTPLLLTSCICSLEPDEQRLLSLKERGMEEKIWKVQQSEGKRLTMGGGGGGGSGTQIRRQSYSNSWKVSVMGRWGHGKLCEAAVWDERKGQVVIGAGTGNGETGRKGRDRTAKARNVEEMYT